MSDAYLQEILKREEVGTGLYSPAGIAQSMLNPTIREWAGSFLTDFIPSGSFAKGTANRSGTDVDLFISLSETCDKSLRDIYELLYAHLAQSGLTPKRQNVSINVKLDDIDVDLVPAKRQHLFTSDHSLYRRRADTWTKTNIFAHIDLVRRSGRANEIRIMKLWRQQKNLDFPSFYLELTTINALSGHFGTLSENVFTVLKYLSDKFTDATIIDPANSNNIISDDLTSNEKARVRQEAQHSLSAAYWSDIVK